MIIELKKEEFKKVKTLFKDVFFNLNSLAVLNGDNEGRVWINNLENLKTGMLVDNEWSIYLIGDHTNKTFNKEIGKIIRKEIFPKAEEHALKMSPEYNNGEWVVYFSRNEWLEVIEQDFGITDFLPLRRCYYILKELKKPNWREEILPSFSMQRVDKDFLHQNHLGNFSIIEEWIENCWRSTEEFLSRGFAFCLLKDDKEIISWGICDWATENRAEMGVGTSENYRRQGFATLVTSAAAEYCLEKEIELGWHCSEHNVASWKTAEKVGFEKERDYISALGCFDENHNLLENSWYVGLYLKRTDEGLSYIDRLIAKTEPDSRYLSIKAQILIQAGKPEEALEVFNKAVNLGLNDPERFKSNIMNNNFFEPIKKLKEFPFLIEKIDRLIEYE